MAATTGPDKADLADRNGARHASAATRHDLHFTVLASGSAGNASLVESEGFALLLDVGLGPRQLANRMRAIGADLETGPCRPPDAHPQRPLE